MHLSKMALRPSDKCTKKDVGDHLMSLLESDRMQEREQELKQEIAQLQNKAHKLKERRDNLKNDLKRNININKNDSRGQLHPIKVSSFTPIIAIKLLCILENRTYLIIFIIVDIKFFSFPTT